MLAPVSMLKSVATWQNASCHLAALNTSVCNMSMSTWLGGHKPYPSRLRCLQMFGNLVMSAAGRLAGFGPGPRLGACGAQRCCCTDGALRRVGDSQPGSVEVAVWVGLQCSMQATSGIASKQHGPDMQHEGGLLMTICRRCNTYQYAEVPVEPGITESRIVIRCGVDDT